MNEHGENPGKPSLRLQTYIAHCGICSRRKAESLITAGKVRVDNKVVTKLGTKINPDLQKVEVNGTPIRLEKRIRVIMMNKPERVLSTVSDQRGRKTVISLLADEVEERVYPVGRLDYDSGGLILLTNDGNLANRLTHPRHEVEKEYEVEVNRMPDAGEMTVLRNGVPLEDGLTARAEVRIMEKGEGRLLSITLHEGKKREIRRMLKYFGIRVKRLTRIRIGNLRLGRLNSGTYRNLNEREIKALKAHIDSEEREQ